MQSFEDKMHSGNLFEENLIKWFGYIDDVFMVWRGPESLLEQFFWWCNILDSNIKFYTNYKYVKIRFLDSLSRKIQESCTQRYVENQQIVTPICGSIALTLGLYIKISHVVNF